MEVNIMAGPFTHWTICDEAKSRKGDVGLELWKFLNGYSEFMYLGSESPDLPYLSVKFGHFNWADVMHYERTNSIVVSGYNDIKEAWLQRKQADEAKFAWLLGYVSHMVADATIHPIVNEIVGAYKQNQEEHRICEMTQDALIYNQITNNEIRYGEISSTLKFCKESEYFDELMEFWKIQLIQDYEEKHKEAHPAFWFKTYTDSIDTGEGGSGVVAYFRHLGLGQDYIYKTKTEIMESYPQYKLKYYEDVKTPKGKGTFLNEGFERTVRNVVKAWKSLYLGLTGDLVVSEIIKDWNLDTGVDRETNQMTYWM